MPNHDSLTCDVAIIGGGPAGSTTASMLKKYMPELSVVVLERAKFPRDHVGESQLPSIGPILDEMGVWDKVEAAGFPVKIGASYTWGCSNDRWDFDFYPPEEWLDEPRPAKFEGQRRHTAFQVDRAIYDDILLKHAASLGTDVHEESSVRTVHKAGDQVDHLELEDGRTVRARHYVDATGTVGLLRKTFDIGADVPEALKNLAIWDYWQNADWAVEIGVGATRVQVRSLPYGWIWFIPLGPTRTSIGLICPAEYYKASGKSPEELYVAALAEQEELGQLIVNAEREEGGVQTCRDYSNLPHRLVGKNWFLVGEAAGFADPILAAGMSIAHSSAREAAYTIMELDHGEHDEQWLRTRFDERNRNNVAQHIRFAQFWYSANARFTDLKDHCSEIAREAGLRLRPDDAWRWLSQGGFTTEFLGVPSLGSFDISTTRQIIGLFDTKERKSKFLIDGYNVFDLNLKGAEKGSIGQLKDGHIELIECYQRGGRTLPDEGLYGVMIDILKQHSDITDIIRQLQLAFPATSGAETAKLRVSMALQALDVMISEQWVRRSLNKKKPKLTLNMDNSRYIRTSQETDRVLAESADGPTYETRI